MSAALWEGTRDERYAVARLRGIFGSTDNLSRLLSLLVGNESRTWSDEQRVAFEDLEGLLNHRESRHLIVVSGRVDGSAYAVTQAVAKALHDARAPGTTMHGSPWLSGYRGAGEQSLAEVLNHRHTDIMEVVAAVFPFVSVLVCYDPRFSLEQDGSAVAHGIGGVVRVSHLEILRSPTGWVGDLPVVPGCGMPGKGGDEGGGGCYRLGYKVWWA